MPTHAPKGPIIKRLTTTAELDPIRREDLMSTSCVATSKGSGKPCKYPAIPGGTVCRFHGGGAPQVKMKALERLQAFQDTAISRLFALAQDESFPSTSYQAVRDVLDRTMGKPTETVKQEHSGALVIRHETADE